MTEMPRSHWHEVKEGMNAPHITFGRHLAYWLHRSPRRMLHAMSYYKFAAKMIGPGKSVLDIGCGEGLGTWLLAKECGQAMGVDFDEPAIETARTNWKDSRIGFECRDIFTFPRREWDAIVSFDLVEHILPDNADRLYRYMADCLAPDGVVIVGTPNLPGQQYASEISKAGHVNVYTGERLATELETHFHHVFMFGGNDEVVHTGFLPMAHYLLALGCGKR